MGETESLTDKEGWRAYIDATIECENGHNNAEVMVVMVTTVTVATARRWWCKGGDGDGDCDDGVKDGGDDDGGR